MAREAFRGWRLFGILVAVYSFAVVMAIIGSRYVTKETIPYFLVIAGVCAALSVCSAIAGIYFDKKSKQRLKESGDER